MQTRSFIVYTLIFVAVASIAAHLYCAKKHKPLQTHATSPKKDILPVVIVGGGIGGLSAGIQLGFLKPHIFQGSLAGGQLSLSHAVQNWPGTISASGQEIVSTLENEATHAGCTIIPENITSITRKKSHFKICTLSPDSTSGEESQRVYYAHSVVFAAGTTPTKLQIPGEDEFWGKGVSNCAICDGALHKGNVVAVVGGGEAALLEAQYLSTLAKTVYIIVRKNTFRSHEASRLAFVKSAPNITVLFNRAITAIVGSSGRLTKIALQDTATNKEAGELALDGLFQAIGSQPNSTPVRKLVSCDELGHVRVQSDFSTTTPGFFAIGDVTQTHYRQAIMVTQQAAQAATSVQEYLAKKGLCPSVTKIPRPSHLLAQHAVIKHPKADESAENCVIIGSGSTGMTAAIYLGHAGARPAVIEGATVGGSLITTPLTVSWPSLANNSGADITSKLKKHARAAGATFHAYEVTNIDTCAWPYTITCVSPTNRAKKVFLAKSILLTTNKPISITTDKKIELDTNGYYKTTSLFETSIPHIFAAGSAIANQYNNHTVGAGQGAETALNIVDNIQQLEPLVPPTAQTPASVPVPVAQPSRPKKQEIPHLLSIKEYNREVQKGGRIVIDCFAHWCPPCKKLKPVLERIYQENTYPDVHFYAIDVDEAAELAQHLEIQSLPTLLFIQDGEIIKSERGFGGEARLHSLLKNTFKKP